jgi:hypothetical protein
MTGYLPGETPEQYAERLHSEMLKVRGAAVQAYGTVEQALSGLCAFLLDTVDREAAGIVFFRLTSTHRRNEAIELLLKKKFGSRFDAFWHGLPGSPGKPKTSGLMALIRQLDETRNQIVHWTAVVNLTGPDDQGRLLREDALQPPNIWAITSPPRQLKVADVVEFTWKASFVARSINMFVIYPKIPEHVRNTWHDVFQQPCTYPPEESHPLAPTLKAPETVPPSSGA